MFVSTSVIVKNYYAIKNEYFTYRCPVGIVIICKLPKRRMDMSLRPTREEMIKMAVETRKQVTSAVVSREEMERYPARVAPMRIQVRAGD